MDVMALKFRVWDEKQKRYGLSIYAKSDADGITEIIPPASEDGRFKIEQSSGKVDKNGKLIFENDVLMRIDHHGNKYFAVVSWYQGNMTLYENPGHSVFVWDGLNWEVIGNVHEMKVG